MKILRRRIAPAVIVAAMATVLPTPALARSAPATLAVERSIGALEGRSPVVRPNVPVGYLGISWTAGRATGVRFRRAGHWGPWREIEVGDTPPVHGRTYSTLVPGAGAEAYQLRGPAAGVRAVAIDTTHGPRRFVPVLTDAEASAALGQPPVVSRAAWGADESFRFRGDGSEVWPPAFYPMQKLIVHHTATQNDDPDPAATVRAIYYYHAVTQGYGDIGYNFLVAGNGTIYKGRYSGPAGSIDQDTATGEDASGDGVTAAHVGGYNSGTMGIAILGDYTSASVPATARAALVDHLAWESDHHGLDPLGVSTYTNPVSGAQKTIDTISGHRDWAATECPGGTLYAELPAIRRDVAAQLGAPPPDTQPPVISGVGVSGVTRTSAVVSWATNEPGTSQVAYWVSGTSTVLRTPLDVTLVTAHRVSLSGLRRRTRYAFRVTSADAAGNEATSSTSTFRTKR